jgi:hypothetical protein
MDQKQIHPSSHNVYHFLLVRPPKVSEELWKRLCTLLYLFPSEFATAGTILSLLATYASPIAGTHQLYSSDLPPQISGDVLFLPMYSPCPTTSDEHSTQIIKNSGLQELYLTCITNRSFSSIYHVSEKEMTRVHHSENKQLPQWIAGIERMFPSNGYCFHPHLPDILLDQKEAINCWNFSRRKIASFYVTHPFAQRRGHPSIAAPTLVIRHPRCHRSYTIQTNRLIVDYLDEISGQLCMNGICTPTTRTESISLFGDLSLSSTLPLSTTISIPITAISVEYLVMEYAKNHILLIPLGVNGNPHSSKRIHFQLNRLFVSIHSLYIFQSYLYVLIFENEVYEILIYDLQSIVPTLVSTVRPVFPFTASSFDLCGFGVCDVGIAICIQHRLSLPSSSVSVSEDADMKNNRFQIIVFH